MKKIFLLFAVFSLLLAGCENPLMEKILGNDKKDGEKPGVQSLVFYTVTFDSMGGSYVDSQRVAEGGTASIPDNPVLDGKGFVHWCMDKELPDYEYFFDTPVYGDITLYAMWSDVVYTVTLDSIWGSVGSQIIGKGGHLIKPPEQSLPTLVGLYLNMPYPAPESIKITGWYDEDNNHWDFEHSEVNGNMNLYAKWDYEPIPLWGDDNDVEKAIAYVSEHAAEGAYTLLVGANETNIQPQTITNAGFNLTIQGLNGEKTIQYSSTTSSSLFTISNASAKLTLGNNITLRGVAGGATSLVRVTSGTLVMEEGSKITGHTNGDNSTDNSKKGGAVHIDTGGTFIMNSGEISGNFAGVVAIATAEAKGGGVYINGGTFTMNGGEISDNYGRNDGGGVYIANGTFNMSGGIITENTAGAGAGGGGVYFNNGIFTVGGTAKILGNFQQDPLSKNKDAHLYCDSNGNSRFITLGNGTNSAPKPITGANGMIINVSINESPLHNGIIVQSGATAEIVNCFHADAAGKEVVLDGNQLVIVDTGVKVINGSTTTYHPNLASALDSITAAGTYTVSIYENQTLAPRTLPAGTDITLTTGNTSNPVEIQIPAATNGSLFTVNTGVTLTLDSGVTLRRNNSMGNNNAPLVTVSGGELNMRTGANLTGNSNSTTNDSGGVRLNSGTFNMYGGTISGVRGTRGGGVNIGTGGTFNMKGGEISNNTSTSTSGSFYGVGVYNAGTFNMEGGEISDNSVSNANFGNFYGGGVYNEGTFTMSGGEIKGNSVNLIGGGSARGGGVYNKGTFMMSSGEISGNFAPTGGGVFFEGGFTVGGTAKISGNKVSLNDSTLSNVYLLSGAYITLGTGNPVAPTTNMSVYVRTATPSGVIVNSGASASHVQYFHADEDGNGVGHNAGKLIIVMDTVPVADGTFMMGSTTTGSNEYPQHQVTLTQGFSMSKYQVTQAQYQTVMGSLPNNLTANDYGKGDNYPVYYVSWYDAIVFCNKLSEREGLTPAYSINSTILPSEWGAVPTSSNATWNAVIIVTGSNGYRLPTEAQWEFAAKGGALASSPYKIYSGSDTADDVAWYGEGNTSTHPVGTKAPNDLGLYDMSGNVWEWCWDWYETYPNTAQTDPIGSSLTSGNRVVRGGGYRQSETEVRSVSRGGTLGPHSNWDDVGFRVVRPVQ